MLGDSPTLRYYFFKLKAIFDGEAIGIIVEIDKYGFIFSSPILDFPCPLF
jgi:hypothetical protein